MISNVDIIDRYNRTGLRSDLKLRSMAPLYGDHDYYKRMLELQEKLRKSEEERIRLEERFKILSQESHNRHDACINRLQLRYIEFLEEQRIRDERNHKLLGALDRVDSNLALMTAKTDRLSVLRKQYEAYLLRAYASRGHPGSITGDSGIASQNEERYFRKNIDGQANLPPSETKTVSSPQIYRPSYQVNQSLSPSGLKLNEPMQNVFSTNHQTSETTPARISTELNYQPTSILRSSSTLQPCIDPSSHQMNVHQFLPTNISSQVSQNVQRQGSNSQEIISRQLQDNMSPRMTSFAQINPPYQQSVSQLNKSDRVDDVQVTPRLLISEPTDGNVHRYRSVDVIQSQVASPISKDYFNSSPIAQSFHRHDSKVSFDYPQSRMRNDDRIVPLTMRRGVQSRLSDLSRAALANPSLSSINRIGPITGYIDQSLRNHNVQRSLDEVPIRSMTVSDVDEMLRRQEVLRGINSSPYKLSPMVNRSSEDGNDKNERTSMTSENELDRYMNNIRNLHRIYDMQSLEELDHEQNTSGDLLNVTLSDDEVELSVEDKVKEERLPEEVEKVLTLANDLACRTVESNTEEGENRRRELIQGKQSVAPISESGRAVSLKKHEGYETSVAPAKDEISNDIALHVPELELRESVAKQAKQDFKRPDVNRLQSVGKPQLPEARGDMENNDDSVNFLGKQVVEKQNEDFLGDAGEKGDHGIDSIEKGNESEVEHLSDVVGDLEPWNLQLFEKEIREIRSSDDDDKDESVEIGSSIEIPILNDSKEEQIKAVNEVKTTENICEKKLQEEVHVAKVDSLSTTKLQPDANESHETLKDIAEKEKPEKPITKPSASKDDEVKSESQNQMNESNTEENRDSEAKGILEEQKRFDKREGEPDQINYSSETNQDNQIETTNQNEKHSMDQKYIEEPKQTIDYTDYSNQSNADVNQEYMYNQNAQYEVSQNEEYKDYANQEYTQETGGQYGEYEDGQYNQYAENPDMQYQQDPNAQYEQDPNAQYQQDPNAQYEQDPNAQYQQDPNAQYEQDPNAQYQQDPNVQYEQDPNAQYQQDPNAQYEQDPNAQYQQDPNAQYEQDPNTQYEQDPNAQYQQDPNAQYERDPNAQYEQDPNAQYEQDPNAQYEQDPNQQYDGNQAYETDPNQSYAYGDTYDGDQLENKVQEQADSDKQEYQKPEESESKYAEDLKEKGEEKSEERNPETNETKKKKDVIKSLLDSDTESTIERNVSNTESEFDFN